MLCFDATSERKLTDAALEDADDDVNDEEEDDEEGERGGLSPLPPPPSPAASSASFRRCSSCSCFSFANRRCSANCQVNQQPLSYKRHTTSVPAMDNSPISKFQARKLRQILPCNGATKSFSSARELTFLCCSCRRRFSSSNAFCFSFSSSMSSLICSCHWKKKQFSCEHFRHKKMAQKKGEGKSTLSEAIQTKFLRTTFKVCAIKLE